MTDGQQNLRGLWRRVHPARWEDKHLLGKKKVLLKRLRDKGKVVGYRVQKGVDADKRSILEVRQKG